MPSTFTIFDPHAIERQPATNVYGRNIPHGNIGNSGALEKLCMHFCENYMREHNGSGEAVVVSRIKVKVNNQPHKEVRCFNLDNRPAGQDGGYPGAISQAECLFSGDWRLATADEVIEFKAQCEHNAEVAKQTAAEEKENNKAKTNLAIIQSSLIDKESENIKLRLELARLEAANKAVTETKVNEKKVK